MSSEETYNSSIHAVTFGFQYAQNKSFTEKVEKAQWYTSKKFLEESIGLLHHYMERLYSTIYAIKNRISHQDEQHFISVLEQAKIKFGKKDFPTKIKEFKIHHSNTIDFEDHVTSLNKARNCFVHRLGVVSNLDTNNNNNLTVKWRAFRIDEKKFIDIERNYEIGTTIILDYQECMDTTYTLISYFEVLFNTCITNIGLNKDDPFYEFLS